jgi:hypothetical protein
MVYVPVLAVAGSGELTACTSKALPAALLAALEQRSEEEEKQVGSHWGGLAERVSNSDSGP